MKQPYEIVQIILSMHKVCKWGLNFRHNEKQNDPKISIIYFHRNLSPLLLLFFFLLLPRAGVLFVNYIKTDWYYYYFLFIMHLSSLECKLVTARSWSYFLYYEIPSSYTIYATNQVPKTLLLNEQPTSLISSVGNWLQKMKQSSWRDSGIKVIS